MNIKPTQTENLKKNIKGNLIWYMSCTLLSLFLILYIFLVGMYTIAFFGAVMLMLIATHFLILNARDIIRIEIRNKDE